MFGFTDDDLVRLRAGAQTPDKHTRISLYGAVLQAVQSGAEDDFTRRVQAFYQRLTALRRMARSVPVEELLEEIFVSTGYLAALGAMENGQRRREDARRFASFCAGAGAGGISALVRAIDAATLAGSTGQETAPGGARPGCVTIMTIHRSKGSTASAARASVSVPRAARGPIRRRPTPPSPRSMPPRCGASRCGFCMWPSPGRRIS